MSLILKKETKSTKILVWEINETLSKLEKKLTISYPKKIKIEQRKKEFISTRLLLKEYNPSLEINYDKNGSPKLNSLEKISISHSNKFTAICVSNNNIGIDIEEINDRNTRLSKKFVNSHHNIIDVESCTLIWCIKEATYKYHMCGNVDFKKDIIVPKFKVANSGEIYFQFRKDKMIANYFRIKDNFLVYVCKL
tara:strand:- start:71255 stop:71836 length:582 start_codon:yes stop_codon:yes gene_type:complete